ncbi:MAG: O-antigen ligase family protein [Verrucomicrobiales bacterium]|nr:O-antigen ligase family protein [Verrucomicrobiales bacterium]
MSLLEQWKGAMNNQEPIAEPLPRFVGMDPTHLRRESLALNLLIQVPLYLYLCSLWLVRPLALGDTFSLTLMAPGFLLVALIVLRIPREFFLSKIRLVRFEFFLLLSFVLLSILSLVNSDSPIRSFRIIFPSLLPFAIFAHYVVLAWFAPHLLQRVPRLLIACAVIFSVIPLGLTILVPPLEPLVFGSYRMKGFFENPIQHSICLATLMPLITVEFSLAKKFRWKIFWSLLFVVMLYTLFRAGSKSAMGVAFLFSVMLYALLAFRSRNFVKIATVLVGLVLAGIFLKLFGLMIAEMINPIIAEKIRSIIEGGVSNYQSIESRKLLWEEAIRQGKMHWLVGTGAGEKVHGISHSHNLVLDYFKGIGIFGAIGIALLCLSIIGRTGWKALTVVSGRGCEIDIRVLACLIGSTVYVICNQLSDCFGPTTIGFLWVNYLTAVFMEREKPGRLG